MDRRRFLSTAALAGVAAASGCTRSTTEGKNEPEAVKPAGTPEQPAEANSVETKLVETNSAEAKPAQASSGPIGSFEVSDQAYAPTTVDDGVDWYDLKDLPIEGRGWAGQERPEGNPFCRFPKRWMDSPDIPDDVKALANNTTGMAFRFRTDKSPIMLRYELRGEPNHKLHWPATGTSGLDLYARDEKGVMRWYDNTKPGTVVMQNVFKDIPPADREYLIYFPLINGLRRIELGLPQGASMKVVLPKQPPIVIYGSSVANGGCASRPGMACTAIISRRLNMPYLSLGFAGCGRMEQSMAELLAELDASVYILDCVPNMWCEWIPQRFNPFIKALRKKRPDVPIVMVEDAIAPHSWLNAKRAEHHRKKHEAQRAEYAKLQKEGIKGLFYVEGDHLFPEDGEGSVDNVHPTDYGFMRHADIIGAAVRKALEG